MHANLIKKMRNANQSKCRRIYQPHIRIEIDDIHDVPVIYVNGKRRFSIDTDEPLVSLVYDWHTDEGQEVRKSLDVEYYDLKSLQVVRQTISNMYRS
ncbi:hypothetical protein [Weissella paramesenteroides]|uniref:hypothetical protein n=1 Tax=Weissella paramesenteroides TaxID=1249 RepID=UPI00123A576D|nr:hypothetical protein [Weissella paramesenteroides]KAA8445033.1 hypothetical protein FKV72_07735 [Weissella paramesenteroides]KAA8452630.1 hypothetical protein FKV71_04435 [Weissella paramesenteroides]